MSLDQASVVFNHPNKITLSSVRQGGDRWADITLVEIHGVVLVLVLVIRNTDTVRPISLRRASKAERTMYANWIEVNKSQGAHPQGE
ncbi:MAG: BrnT family toxin [Betaproteobacteria bacterium]|jgi:uncharacterized protein